MSRTKGHTHPSKCTSCKYWKHGRAKGKDALTARDKRAATNAQKDLETLPEELAPDVCVYCGREDC